MLPPVLWLLCTALPRDHLSIKPWRRHIVTSPSASVSGVCASRWRSCVCLEEPMSTIDVNSESPLCSLGCTEENKDVFVWKWGRLLSSWQLLLLRYLMKAPLTFGLRSRHQSGQLLSGWQYLFFLSVWLKTSENVSESPQTHSDPGLHFNEQTTMGN